MFKEPSWPSIGERSGEGFPGERIGTNLLWLGNVGERCSGGRIGATLLLLLGHTGGLSASGWDTVGLGIFCALALVVRDLVRGCGGWNRGAILMRNTPGPGYGSWGPLFDDRAASRVAVARSRSRLSTRMLRKLSSSGWST